MRTPMRAHARKAASVTVTVQRQRPIQGGRIRKDAGFDPRVWKALEKESLRFGVSIPFILSVMAADTLGVPLSDEDRYRPNIRRVK